jgi:hypothetical protein
MLSGTFFVKTQGSLIYTRKMRIYTERISGQEIVVSSQRKDDS